MVVGGEGLVTVLVSSQNDIKWTISASNDHFARWDWVEFQEKHLFSWTELSKSQLKALGLQNGHNYLFLCDQWKSPPPLKSQSYAFWVMRSAKQGNYLKVTKNNNSNLFLTPSCLSYASRKASQRGSIEKGFIRDTHWKKLKEIMGLLN